MKETVLKQLDDLELETTKMLERLDDLELETKKALNQGRKMLEQLEANFKNIKEQ